jgi:PilZ domain
MNSPTVRVERRVGQRFPYLLPVSFRLSSNGLEGVGFTQDLSSKGVFVLTDVPLCAGSSIEITLTMPSEITLGESMPVRCQGRVLRVNRPASCATEPNSGNQAETKIGAAILLESYEYLHEASEYSRDFSRVLALHSRPDEDRPVAQAAGRAVQR